MGYYTVHAYPHSSESSCLPETLKGLDMAMWEVFQALGCGVCLRPIVVHPDDSDMPGRKRTYILADFDIGATDNYAESEEELDEMLGKKYGQDKLDYAGVAWLNQSSGHQEFQIGYTAVSENVPMDYLSERERESTDLYVLFNSMETNLALWQPIPPVPSS